jgi:hypothetical protein
MALANVVGMVVSIQKRQKRVVHERTKAIGKVFNQFPDESEWERCYDARMLMLNGCGNFESTVSISTYCRLSLSSSWQPIILVWTKTIVAFGKAGEKCLIDAVPLSDISEVGLMQEISGPAGLGGSSLSPNERGGDDAPNHALQSIAHSLAKPRKVQRNLSVGMSEGTVASNNFFLVTEEEGYNSGRKYYIQANSDTERREIIEMLTKVFKAAKKAKELQSRYARVKEKLHRITSSNQFQYFFAMLILAVSPPNPLLSHKPCTLRIAAARRERWPS